jgi:2-C-methyl-D-erythritol 2,4-cyclodiphosphate synthase
MAADNGLLDTASKRRRDLGAGAGFLAIKALRVDLEQHLHRVPGPFSNVLCHALVDALVGAIADGDLGTHFPEDDPEATDARSLGFVHAFARHVERAGYAVGNVDCFVVLGTVRLRAHIEAMRQNLADALGIDRERVSVKARSNDGLGAEGEGTACAAWANVLVYRVS